MLSSSDVSNTSCVFQMFPWVLVKMQQEHGLLYHQMTLFQRTKAFFFFVCNIFFVCSLDYVHRHRRFLNSTLEIVAVYLFMCDMGIFFVIMVDLAAAEVDDEDHLGPLTIFIPPKGVMR